jgi:hypothetical protein
MGNRFMLLVFIFFLLSCKEDDLPKPTQNGSGTFACKVDGEVYIPSIQDFKRSAKNAILDNNTIVISGLKENSNSKEAIVLNIRNFKGEAAYNLSEKDVDHFALYYLNGQYYYTNADYTGKVTITHFDETKKIVSGTFDFKVLDTQTNEVVNISEGRFDLYYD